MSSPSQTPNPSPTQSPSQSRSNHNPNPGGPVPSPSATRGSSSRPTSQPPTPNASQPSSRASSLTPSPHIAHVPRGSTPTPTPPTSKSPSQSALKSISRNASQTPPVPLARSSSHSSASYIGPLRAIPSTITPYVPSFLKEPPFFQPPTSPLPQFCIPSTVSKHTAAPESLYFPLLPPPPHQPQVRCTYPTPPALFTPPSSLTYTPPIDVLVRGKPHVVPSLLPPTFYTPFSRYYSHPRPHRPLPRRRPSPTFSLPSVPYDSLGRSVHFFSK
uniref:Uncharacterized protein n=1 Tax=Rousettus aegyptiacus TaxID=9407 RepID=A0A7J8G2V7_ROUAE|nr:hypothetical protein HJG63_000132 [Rousettus aegyptiacus]